MNDLSVLSYSLKFLSYYRQMEYWNQDMESGMADWKTLIRFTIRPRVYFNFNTKGH